MYNKLKNPGKIIVKIGTAIITNNNVLNVKWLESKIREIADLHKQGREIIIVTSGAVGTGMQLEGLRVRPKNILKLQLLSGKGQPVLIRIYSEAFSKYGIHTSQVLLTHHNFSKQEEIKLIKDVLNSYLKEGTIPIINENDIISKEEFASPSTGGFSDNDELAGLIAKTIGVDMLLILTDVDGLYSEDPRINPKAEFIPVVKKVTQRIIKMASNEGNSLGRGGMYSKVLVARDAAKYGVITIVANGKYKLADILNNNVKRTVFFSF